MITRLQASREPYDFTPVQLSIVVWKMSVSSEKRFVGVSQAETDSFAENMKIQTQKIYFVLFNSMLKYVINRLMHVFAPYQDCYGKGHALIYK